MPVEDAVLDATGADEGIDSSRDDSSLGDELDGQDEGVEDGAADDADSSEDDSDATGDDAAAEDEGDKEQVTADGRKMPDSLKKAIAALKPTSPEAAKEIKGLFFSNQEYRQVFPKPADAIAAKTLIDEVGGQEGIQAIHAEREEWAGIDKGFAEGSPEFVKAIADNNPEGFNKTAISVMNEFASRAPEQYGYYANKVALNTVLQQPGVESGLQVLAKLHEQLGEAPWAQQAIANVVNGIVGLKDKALQFEQKRVDPREEQLKQKETAFETRRRADFEGGIAEKAETYLKEKMQPEIDRIVGNRKVSAATMDDYRQKVQAEVQRRLAALPGFETQLETFYRTGDAKKSAEYIQAQYNRILPEAAKVIDPYVRDIRPSSAPVGDKPATRDNGGQQRSTSAGEVTLKEMPDWDQLDPNWRSQPNATSEMMQGRAVLKNGKKATGWV